MFESLFEFLFKFRPIAFERGDLAFGAAWPVYLLVTGLVLGAGAAAYTYARVREDVPARARRVLTALRVSALLVLALCLLRPTLLVSTSLPQQNFLAVLIDDSRSMRLPGADGAARARFVEQAFGPEGDVLRKLSARYTLRYFGFGGDARRIGATSDLTYDASETKLGAALDRVRQEMAGVPLAGVVVVSDGADNAAAPLGEALLPIRSAGIPVFTVGVGADRFARDVQVTRVQAPSRVLKGSTLVVDVLVTQRGYRGARVPLFVEDEGRIVAQEEIPLPDDGTTASVRVRFPASEAGPHRFRFRIPNQQGEVVPQNNAQETLITVEDRRAKILYFEGEPRFEVKFLRRAIADDPNLQLVVLQRTAEGKFLRLDVDSGEELVAGFPDTREDLYQYSAIVLGSVEASFFTHEQLQMLADFASRRGGGLLMLGGRRAFSEGGYAGTPLEEAMPVYLERRDAGQPAYFASLKISPTPAGAQHPALQLRESADSTRERWRTLPELSSVNLLTRPKPGAAVLLTGESEKTGAKQIVLATQRYGRGKVAALPVQDTWVWRMHADMPLEDRTHEMFWRQTLRWLVNDVSSPVLARATDEAPLPGQSVAVVADVADSTFNPVSDAQVTAEITRPTGERVEIPMEWSVTTDGEYRVSFTPEQPGVHEVVVRAARAGKSLGSSTSYVVAGSSEREYFNAEMQKDVLERVARETGGRFYSSASVGALADEIQYSGSGATVREERDLWDMPMLFLMLIALLGAEWVYRRSAGLA